MIEILLDILGYYSTKRNALIFEYGTTTKEAETTILSGTLVNASHYYLEVLFPGGQISGLEDGGYRWQLGTVDSVKFPAAEHKTEKKLTLKKVGNYVHFVLKPEAKVPLTVVFPTAASRQTLPLTEIGFRIKRYNERVRVLVLKKRKARWELRW